MITALLIKLQLFSEMVSDKVSLSSKGGYSRYVVGLVVSDVELQMIFTVFLNESYFQGCS